MLAPDLAPGDQFVRGTPRRTGSSAPPRTGAGGRSPRDTRPEVLPGSPAAYRARAPSRSLGRARNSSLAGAPSSSSRGRRTPLGGQGHRRSRGYGLPELRSRGLRRTGGSVGQPSVSSDLFDIRLHEAIARSLRGR